MPSDEKKPVTVEELDALIGKMAEQRSLLDKHKEEGKKLNVTLAEMEAQSVSYLKELGRKSYVGPQGRISIVEKWRVKLPQSDEEKQAFFAHLKERGILWKFATVNSNALNSLFLEDWKQAKERGEGMEFKMPGIGDPSLFEDLRFLKQGEKDAAE